jgi:hypothetical protein
MISETQEIIFGFKKLVGAARTRSPATTNYDVHSPTWGDGRETLLPSAMEAASLGNRPSCSPIDPSR